jgi:hypothetical protein
LRLLSIARLVATSCDPCSETPVGPTEQTVEDSPGEPTVIVADGVFHWIEGFAVWAALDDPGTVHPTLDQEWPR